MASAKQSIFEAALRHFAEKGFDGASLRNIMRDAGVNPAAIHYHFGSKQALYMEILAAYLKPLGEQRRLALETALSAPPGSQRDRVMRLVRGYIGPHLKLSGDAVGKSYIRIVSRFGTERSDVIKSVYLQYILPMRNGYLRALAAACPHISPQDIARIFSFMVAVMVTVPIDSGNEPVAGRSLSKSTPETLIEQVVEFATAGFLRAEEKGTSVRKGRKRQPRTRR